MPALTIGNENNAILVNLVLHELVVTNWQDIIVGALCPRDISALRTPPTRAFGINTERLETAPTESE